MIIFEIYLEQVEEANLVNVILEEAEVSAERAEEAASIIQSAYRNFKEKRDKEKSMLLGMVDWRVAARNAIYLYKKTGVTNEEANRAATLIKVSTYFYQLFTTDPVEIMLESSKLAK